MKKFIAVVALALLLFPIVTSAQNATDTNSVLKTGLWQGKYTPNGSGDADIKLNVVSVSGRQVKAQLNFVDGGNSIVELSGDIADSFGDFVEQSHWQFVAKDKKFKDGNWVKFTEVKWIQGNPGTKSTYYGILTDGSLLGCWYYEDDPRPRGRFELHFSE